MEAPERDSVLLLFQVEIILDPGEEIGSFVDLDINPLRTQVSRTVA